MRLTCVQACLSIRGLSIAVWRIGHLLALLQVIDVVIRSPVDDLQNGANAGASSVCTPPGAGAEGYVRSISRQRGQ